MAIAPDLATDLATIARQEAELQFPAFDYDTAWRLGLSLRELALSRKQSIVIDIRRFGQPHQQLFYTALAGPGEGRNHLLNFAHHRAAGGRNRQWLTGIGGGAGRFGIVRQDPVKRFTDRLLKFRFSNHLTFAAGTRLQ